LEFLRIRGEGTARKVVMDLRGVEEVCENPQKKEDRWFHMCRGKEVRTTKGLEGPLPREP